jgi:hypothetical protein
MLTLITTTMQGIELVYKYHLKISNWEVCPKGKLESENGGDNNIPSIPKVTFLGAMGLNLGLGH